MATPVPSQLQEGLGQKYILERELGRGGTATVYLAQDTKHNRPVALKVLRGELTTSLGSERFRREITVAAALHHPHILTVLDSGATPCGQLWFSMPYVQGESVRDRLARDGPLPITDALRIALQTADALQYAHGRGVIHRDIKPGNILLSGSNALVADFGIARLLGADGDTAGDALTTAGLVIGTVGYMSPEQASGVRPLDARTDVFSLGVVLYEMLTGKLPYPVPSDPSAPLPAVPARLDAALRKALAPAPAARWPSAGEFAHALEMAQRAAVTRAVTRALTPVRTRRVLVAALAVGLVIGAASLFAWKSTRTGPPSTTPTGALRLAVLPFENVGDSSDAYFADGVTDAVRGKLTSLAGLEVIGSTSSAQYRHTTKTPQQVGSELGVRYLLTGTVRWAKSPGGTSRVRVSPELIDAGTAADKWEQPFDAPLTDVFQVQSEIAGQVAQQLALALTPAAVQTLASRPTADLAAYNAYLRGEALANTVVTSDVIHRAETLFEEAVGRDSTFALAWAALARVQARSYAYGVPQPALADSADRNSARALALAPDLAEAHTARAGYHLNVRRDPVAALHEDSTALALAPRDASVLLRTANAEETSGRWDAAEAHVADAARLDPRSESAVFGFGDLELQRHHYDQARAALEHAVALLPTDLNAIEDRLELRLLQGDLAGGRAFLRSVPSSVDRSSLIAYVATYGDLGWALDSSDDAHLRGLGPEAFGGDRGAWAFALTEQYAWRGDQHRARAYADTARVAWEAQLKTTPGDAQRHALVGVALAYLGRRDAAIREGEHAAALMPVARDAYLGPYLQHQLARIYILVGQPDRALDTLEPLLQIPYTLTPASLRIDPNFAPLRGNPRFERLAAGDTPNR